MLSSGTMKLLLFYFIIILSHCNAENGKQKEESTKKPSRSYVCPPKFMRLSYKCYYFSNKTATFQEAYWKCRDMHSNIATIKNANQDKVLRKTLDHDAIMPLERWIGGRYDWGTMSWQWAASGKALQYKGFSDDYDKEALNWHCIIMDPRKHYRWSSRMCTDSKHYICQTKVRNVTNKGKKKLQKQYKADKNNKLNEVAVPEIRTNNIPNDIQPYNWNYKENNAFAYRSNGNDYRKRQNKKDTTSYKNINGTIIEPPRRSRRKENKKSDKHKQYERSKHNSIEKIRWKTYYEGTPSPLHPRVAVEEFSYS